MKMKVDILLLHIKIIVIKRDIMGYRFIEFEVIRIN